MEAVRVWTRICAVRWPVPDGAARRNRPCSNASVSR
jgi:hypothetical protein